MATYKEIKGVTLQTLDLGLVVEIGQQAFKQELVLERDLQLVLQQQETYIHLILLQLMFKLMMVQVGQK